MDEFWHEFVNEPLAIQPDDMLKQQITPPGDMAVDQYLVELAKTADLNFIADATVIPANLSIEPFPASAEAIHFKSPPRLDYVLDDVHHAYGLAYLRFQPKTFLWWKAPTLGEIKPLVFEQMKHRLRTLPHTLPTKEEKYAVLSDYLKKTHGWDGLTPNVDVQVPFSSLPQEMQSWFFKTHENYLLDNRPDLLVKPEFWPRQARLKLVESERRPGRKFSRLQMYTNFGNAQAPVRILSHDFELFPLSDWK